MSASLVTRGLGSPMLVTDGLGDYSAATEVADCIVELGDAEIFVGMEKVASDWYLLYRDASNEATILLPLSVAQATGTAWCMIRIRRSGSSLLVYLDKTLVATIVLSSVETCENSAVVLRGKDHTLFDLRVNNAAVSKLAGDYCYDDITQNYGKSMLPSAA